MNYESLKKKRTLDMLNTQSYFSPSFNWKPIIISYKYKENKLKESNRIFNLFCNSEYALYFGEYFDCSLDLQGQKIIHNILLKSTIFNRVLIDFMFRPPFPFTLIL